MAARPSGSESRVMPEQGYDVELACGQPVDTKYICPVCLSVMRDAMQTACGHRFCKTCIIRVAGQRPWGKCPVDKTILGRSEQLFNDVAMRREILSLKIKCQNGSDGCCWTGELRDVEKHLTECPLEKIQCPIGCDQTFLRCEFPKHSKDCPQRSVVCDHCKESVVFAKIHKHEVVDCPKYPVPCTLCGEKGIPRGEIASHIDSTNGSCPLASVLCKFRPVGCHFQDKRKDMQKHYDNSLECHLSLVMGRVVELKLTNQAQQEELNKANGKLSALDVLVTEQSCTIKHLKERSINGRLLWKVDVGNVQPLPNMVFSPAFYSSCPGYQMRLRLDFRGAIEGEEVYSSLFVVLQKGEFDQDLLFPFNGQVRVVLIPQTGVRSRQENFHHLATVINCKDVPRNNSGNMNARQNSRGKARFMKQKELLSSTYSKHGVLFFDISMVLEHDGNQTRNTNMTLSQIPGAV